MQTNYDVITAWRESNKDGLPGSDRIQYASLEAVVLFLW
jgi:hypothetical protein